MSTTIEKPKIMSLSEDAARRVREIMADSQTPVAGVRIGVKNAGCVGMEYTLDYVEAPDPGDDVVQQDGAVVFVDPKAILFLLGTKMDYKVDKLSAGFVFDNPNQTDACGCGSSVAITPANEAQLQAFEKPLRVS